jgi:galactitol-specific phosphotransferase system IIB component
MKMITLLILLLTITIGNAQTLPIDFETTIVTTNFVDFDGGTATVMANPQSNADNNSATVGQIVRNGGQPWGGSKITLASNLDFSTMNNISMKVYTAAPVGTTVKLKIENAMGGSAEIDVLTTVTNQWETLTWDFVGTPTDFNTIVLMFDFGNVGNGTATSTFLFDDMEQYSTPAQISLPMDFETTVVTADFTNFDGATATVMANPQSNADNNSATVGQIIRNGGQPWGGSIITLASNLDFSTMNNISMKVYTAAPVGTTVRLKLEDGIGGFVELDVLTTLTNQWETLTWDFSGTANSFNTLVLMFDFGNIGNGTATSTFLFDDIEQSSTALQIGLPMDFETTVVTANFSDFDGGTATVMANPQSNADNNSATVGQMVRNGGQPWGGSAITLSSNLDFATMNNISMKVYTAAPIGTTVRLKLEDGIGGFVELDALTTLTNQWETLTWDFSGTAANFNILVLLFDFGTIGNGSAASTFLFDDIQQSSSAPQINLPIDFETIVVTSDFIDFDGGTAIVMANPQSNADNNSATVGQIVRNGGQIWAGSKIVLSSNLDFSTMNNISMKVYTAAPIGTMVKLKLESTTGSAEIDVLTTTTNQWETLTWDFSGTPADFNTLVLMFDFGNLGNGTATSTFLFDDIAQSSSPIVINLPIDFETTVVTSDFIDFDGGTGTVMANPQSNADNNSATVGQIVRNGGQIWAGSKIPLSANLDFSTMNSISMKVYTAAPIGTTVKLKLESTTGSAEVDVLTTTTNQWETLTWDFTGTPPDFNTLVLMFDFGNLGNGTATSTFLFDDIQQLAGGSQIDFPVDFESSTVNYTMTDFGGNTASLMVDPTNAGNMVMQVIKSDQAAAWAGTTIGTPSGFATNLPLTLIASKMTVRVWSPQAGTPIRLKVEDSNDPTHTCETETNTTVSGGWEQLEFDFSNEAPGTALLSVGLSMGWTYNMASIFFNFGTDGATAGAAVTYYFDDVEFGGLPLGTASLQTETLNVFPNPSSTSWTIASENETITSIEIFDLQGKLLLTTNPNQFTTIVDASEFATGVYIFRIATASKTSTIKLSKQ